MSNTESVPTIWDKLYSMISKLLQYSRRSAFSAFLQGIPTAPCHCSFAIVVREYNKRYRLKVHKLFRPVTVSVDERSEVYQEIMCKFRKYLRRIWSRRESTYGLLHLVNLLTTQCVFLGGPYELSLISRIVTKVLLMQLAGSVKYGQRSAAEDEQKIIRHCLAAKKMLVLVYGELACTW